MKFFKDVRRGLAPIIVILIAITIAVWIVAGPHIIVSYTGEVNWYWLYTLNVFILAYIIGRLNRN